nr:MAG TPA: hypothetical protein [Caudoviricetes sp.]
MALNGRVKQGLWMQGVVLIRKGKAEHREAEQWQRKATIG